MNPTEEKVEIMRQWEKAPALATEITRLKASNKELVEALEEIAQYDKDSKHGPGICPYGCDCPHIARAAIERAKASPGRGCAPSGLNRAGWGGLA